MFQLRSHQKWALWFLALAVLCFTASQIPAIRQRLPWGRSETPATKVR